MSFFGSFFTDKPESEASNENLKEISIDRAVELFAGDDKVIEITDRLKRLNVDTVSMDEKICDDLYTDLKAHIAESGYRLELSEVPVFVSDKSEANKERESLVQLTKLINETKDKDIDKVA